MRNAEMLLKRKWNEQSRVKGDENAHEGTKRRARGRFRQGPKRQCGCCTRRSFEYQ
jgi:hypothetical protein